MKKWLIATLFLCGTAYGDEIYFSPDGGIQDRIVQQIHASTSTIDIAMYSFTSLPVENALIDAVHRNVQVRLIMDEGQSKGKSSGYKLFRYAHVQVKRLRGHGRGIMHDKIGIFDKKLIVTGSYNWTNNAEHNNYENALFIDNPRLVHEADDQFDYLWTVATIEKDGLNIHE